MKIASLKKRNFFNCDYFIKTTHGKKFIKIFFLAESYSVTRSSYNLRHMRTNHYRMLCVSFSFYSVIVNVGCYIFTHGINFYTKISFSIVPFSFDLFKKFYRQKQQFLHDKPTLAFKLIHNSLPLLQRKKIKTLPKVSYKPQR